MCETVTVDLDLYLEYKRCYNYVQNERRQSELYEQKLYQLTHDNQILTTQLYNLRVETNIKLENYNKVKSGSFSDKLDFLFSKE